MNVNLIEEKLENIDDFKLVNIMELLVNAVRDYPQRDLLDLDLYLEEIKSLIKSDQITKQKLIHYSDVEIDLNKEWSFWVGESISSLIEAFDLIELYNYDLQQINKILSY